MRARVQPALVELRSAILDHERCIMGAQLPAEHPVLALYRVHASGRLGSSYDACRKKLLARLAEVGTRLERAAWSETESLRAELAQATAKLDEHGFSSILCSELSSLCEGLWDLRSSFDGAADVWDVEPIEKATVAGSLARCDFVPESIDEHRVDAPPASGGELIQTRSWVADDMVYVMRTTSRPDYGHLDNDEPVLTTTVYRKSVTGPWQQRELAGAWEAEWAGDLLWGLGTVGRDRTARIVIAAQDGVTPGAALPPLDWGSQRISLVEARRRAALPTRIRATGATRSFVDFGKNGSLVGVRVDDDGRGTATRVDTAPPGEAWLRIADSGAFIAIRTEKAGASARFHAFSVPAGATASVHTSRDLEIAPEASPSPCAAGADIWVLAGGRFVLHSADDGATWSEPLALAHPLPAAGVACTTDALLVIGVGEDQSARWSRCTATACTTPVTFAAPLGVGPVDSVTLAQPVLSIGGGHAVLLLPYRERRDRRGVFVYRLDVATGEPSFDRPLSDWSSRGDRFWLIDGTFVSGSPDNGFAHR